MSPPGKVDDSSALSSGQDLAELRSVDPSEYGLGEELARGDMARIVLARDRRHGRIVALKELAEEASELDARFQAEAMTAARLQHPAVVTVLEAGRWPRGVPFFTMHRLEGISLADAMAAAPGLAERLALLPRLLAVAEGMAHAHQRRVVHRDLRPSNVVLGQLGETTIIDWGLSLDMARRDEGEVDAALQTTSAETRAAAYTAPELLDERDHDQRVDVYSIGAILYRLVAGVDPYQGKREVVVEAGRKGGPPPLTLPCPEP